MRTLAIAVLATALILPALPAEATNLGRHLSGARSNFGVSSFGTFRGSGFRGNFRFGSGQRNFRNGYGYRNGPRASFRQRGGLNRRGGFRQGFTRFPSNRYGVTSRDYYRNYNQPRLNLSRQQLFNQRYLEERAQSLRNILGTKESTQQLNSDLFGGNLVNPDRRGASGGSFTRPFAMPVTPGTTAASQNRTPLRRQLKKTNPVRGIISPVPLTQQQKARVNF